MTLLEEAITAITRAEQAIDRRQGAADYYDGAGLITLAIVALAKTLLAIHGGDR